MLGGGGAGPGLLRDAGVCAGVRRRRLLRSARVPASTHHGQRAPQHVVHAAHPAPELVVRKQRVGDAHERRRPEHLEHELHVVRGREARRHARRGVRQHAVQDWQQRREGGVDDLDQRAALLLVDNRVHVLRVVFGRAHTQAGAACPAARHRAAGEHCSVSCQRAAPRPGTRTCAP